MMPTAALARFLKEEVSRIDRNLPQAPPYLGMSPAEMVGTIIGLRVALDAAVGLLREVTDAALPFTNLKDRGEYVLGVITQADIRRLEETLATLRLVLAATDQPDTPAHSPPTPNTPP